MQDLHRGGDNVVIKMDDFMQNIFYQSQLKEMCMRFFACLSQCQDLMLKEVTKLLESCDPKRVVTGGPKFLALNEIGLTVTQCNIKDCIG